MASPGKVLIIVQNLPVPFDRRVWLESTTLKQAGYGVSVISPTGKHGDFKKTHEVIEGINVYRYPAPPEAEGVIGYAFEFSYAWLMTALLSLVVWVRHGFNVMQACNPPETYFLLAWFYKLFGKKLIFDHHDLSPEMYVAKGGKKGGLPYRLLLLLEKLTFKTADVVMTTNLSHKEIAVKRGGFDPNKVFVVRSAPNLDRFTRYDPIPELKEGAPYLICYLGEMCPQDGVDHMLYAAQVVLNEHNRKDVHFTFIGGGPSLEDLRKLKSKLGLDEYITFTGRVSDDDLCRYLSTADICVDPDPFTEWSNQSTMNKIMEYMAFGCPIVAFDLKENHYSAQDAAIYATPNDVDEMAALIVDLLENPDKRQEMGSYGLNRIENELAWQYSQPHLLAAYAAAGYPAGGRE